MKQGSFYFVIIIFKEHLKLVGRDVVQKARQFSGSRWSLRLCSPHDFSSINKIADLSDPVVPRPLLGLFHLIQQNLPLQLNNKIA